LTAPTFTHKVQAARFGGVRFRLAHSNPVTFNIGRHTYHVALVAGYVRLVNDRRLLHLCLPDIRLILIRVRPKTFDRAPGGSR
jgi:hypothetical protein